MGVIEVIFIGIAQYWEQKKFSKLFKMGNSCKEEDR